MASPSYIFSPIEPDEVSLQDSAIEWLQSRWPDWTPSENNLETWQIMALTRMVAEALIVGSDVPPEIFKYFGTTVLGLPPIPAIAASAASTWTVTTNPAGRTISSGSLVAINGPDGTPSTFEVVFDVDLAVGVLTTGVGEVALRSLEEGEGLNGLGGNGIVVDLIDPPTTWIDTITLTAETANGADEELTTDYLDRLSARLTLLTPRPILPGDFSLLARDVARQQGVKVRAVTLDGYNPADDSTGNERMVTTSIVDLDTGADVDAGIFTIVNNDLQAMREVNFVVHMINPTRTPVDVTFEIAVSAGYDPGDTLARTEDAVTSFVSAANWGRSNMSNDVYEWEQTAEVLRQKVSQVIGGTLGVDHWITLTIGINGGAQTAAESFDLPGAIPLATPGVIAGSVA